jgi:hypothetical protein
MSHTLVTVRIQLTNLLDGNGGRGPSGDEDRPDRVNDLSGIHIEDDGTDDKLFWHATILPPHDAVE